MTENEKLMLDMLERTYETLHIENAKREFPLNGLECELGELIAKIKGTKFDSKAMLRDRNKLKRQLGKPDSVKLKELREALKQFTTEQLGVLPSEAFQ